jgi:hypothetical protein
MADLRPPCKNYPSGNLRANGCDCLFEEGLVKHIINNIQKALVSHVLNDSAYLDFQGIPFNNGGCAVGSDSKMAISICMGNGVHLMAACVELIHCRNYLQIKKGNRRLR